MLRMAELFGGVGSLAMAMSASGIPFESVLVEYDPATVNAYNLIHGTDFSPMDIRNVSASYLGKLDILSYSFPCQSLSASGKRAGMSAESGGTSSLIWEVGRILSEYHESELPCVLLMENVPQVLKDKTFPAWCTMLSNMGYVNHIKVMNAVNYGGVQSRKRCIMVSVRNGKSYDFPAECENTRSIKDIVDTSEASDHLFRDNERTVSMCNLFNSIEDNEEDFEVFAVNRRNYSVRRFATTLTTKNRGMNCRESAMMVCDGLRCRYLSERENWRMMGFTDSTFDRIAGHFSDTTLHRFSGNSICLEVQTAIVNSLVF